MSESDIKQEKILSDDLKLLKPIVENIVIIPYDEFINMIYKFLAKNVVDGDFDMINELAWIQRKHTSLYPREVIQRVIDTMDLYEPMIRPYYEKNDAINTCVLYKDNELMPLYKVEFSSSDNEILKIAKV